MKKLVLGLALLTYMFIAMMSAIESHAHCGKIHESEGRVYVAQFSEEQQFAVDLVGPEQQVDDFVYELKEGELEKSLEDHPVDDKVVIDMYNGYGLAKSKDFQLSNGRFNSIAPGKHILKSK